MSAVAPVLKGPRRPSRDARRARIASGVVMFVFVTTHLLNHALGLISLAAMEAGRWAFLALWRNPVGTALLLAAVLTHIGLAAWSIYLRRQIRMPFWEGLQIALGVTIPLLLVDHLVGTRVANEQYGFEDSYTALVLVFWVLKPQLAVWQTILMLVAWTHGCMGIHYWLRMQPWYARIRMVLYTFVVLLPVLAFLGFSQAGRFVATLAADPIWVRETFIDAQAPNVMASAALQHIGDMIDLALGALLAITLAARAMRQVAERGSAVRITYPGARVVSVPVGFSILEASRQARIPHASVCGGRGRCSTCRVRVLSGSGPLPSPGPVESRVLTRLNASPDVRLACQLRPVHDLAVMPLIPPSVEPVESLAHPGIMAGREREVCVMFADLRGFTKLSEKRLPYDVVFLLNRYFEAVGGAIESCGGIPNQFIGDGVMALFGVESGARDGARDAIAAARAMHRAVDELSADLHEALPAPLRIGIGVHCGPAVVGHMGRGVATYLTAVGDTVNTASRLQDHTKEYACELIVSDRAAELAGIDLSAFRHEEISVRNRAGTIGVRIVEDVETLPLDASGQEVPPEK